MQTSHRTGFFRKLHDPDLSPVYRTDSGRRLGVERLSILGTKFRACDPFSVISHCASIGTSSFLSMDSS